MMDIGEAIYAMRCGQKVARKGWNGRGMWLMLIENVQFDYAKRPPTGPSNLYDEPVSVMRINVEPWVGMKTADDKFVPWLASQTDLLAEDWEVV